MLLSRDGLPLAVAQVRPVLAAPGADGTERVMSVAAAKDALLAPGAAAAALQADAEQIRELQFPIPAGDPQDQLSVILRARKVAAGARLLFSSAFAGPSRENLVPGEKLPLPAPLELAVQFFPDAAGALPDATFVDNLRESAPLAPLDDKTAQHSPKPAALGQVKRRARTWTFETKKDCRVTIARSGPVEWSLRRLPDAVLLTARLLPDPRQPAEFGPFVLYLGAAADDAPPEISPLKLDRKETPARDFLEGAVRVYAAGANPFVLAEAAVVAEIACPPKPDGDVPVKRLPCFFWEAPAAAPAEGEFRFRFAPPVEGIYGVRVAVVTASGQSRGDTLSFRAGPPASAGFVKVRPGERQFRMDDGSVFIPIGAEIIAHGKAAVDETRARFVELARRNGNAARLCLSQAGLLLEPDAGRFDPDAAAALDDILRAAQARDIHIILCAETSQDISANSASHPYFREKNGPLAATPEFFRSVAARKLFQNRLTYLAARYGACRSVMAWELLDTVDGSWAVLKQSPDDPKLAPGDADLARRARRDVQVWAEEMALHIKGMDGHEHPVGISTTASPDSPWPDLERVEHLDWTMACPSLPPDERLWDDERYRDEAAVLRSWAAAARQPGRAHKPCLISPSPLRRPVAAAAPPETAEARARSLDTFGHNTLFASLAGGLCGAPLVRWDDKNATRWDSFTAASVFASVLAAAAEAEGKDELRTVDESIDSPAKVPLRVLGQAGGRGMAVWLQDKRATWAAKNECDEIKGVELRLPGLLEGFYRLTWLDTWKGTIVQAGGHKAPGKHIDKPLEPTVVRAPPFKRDIGLLITRVAGGE